MKCSEIGEYGCYIELKTNKVIKKDIICVDKCIVNEIKYLLNQGVETTNCCCGHNKFKPSVTVEENSYGLMKDLGYEYFYNNLGIRIYNLKTIL